MSKFLRDIEIRDDEKLVNTPNITNTILPIELLFLRKLKKVNTYPFGKINIYISDTDGFSIGGLAVEVLDCFVSFDFQKFSSSSPFDRKRQVLDLILMALVNCAKAKGWSTDEFLDAYNDCLREELKNEWLFKNKLFRSPDKKLYAGLFNTFDIEGYFIELALFDKSKKLLSKKIVYRDDYLSFPIEWACWKDDSQSFLFKFDPPQKVFEYRVSEIISENPIILPQKKSDYFKK